MAMGTAATAALSVVALEAALEPQTGPVRDRSDRGSAPPWRSG
jgi:hypothetical protein